MIATRCAIDAEWHIPENLALTLIGVLVAINFFPNLDIKGTDTLLLEIAKFAGILLSFLTQIYVAKGTHALTSRAIPGLSFNRLK